MQSVVFLRVQSRHNLVPTRTAPLYHSKRTLAVHFTDQATLAPVFDILEHAISVMTA